MRFLLFPLAFLYGLITALRNQLYDFGLFKSYKSTLKTIGIGNLQVGGSGKTPTTAWIYTLLKDQENIAILSRGYGRQTKGLIEADNKATPGQIGDEPMWYKTHLKEARIVVSEKREAGLKLLEKTNSTMVLLDDAFQHRAVSLDIQILLTEYRKPFYKDFLLPVGRLRESRQGAGRADIVVVTKCPNNIGEAQMADIRTRIQSHTSAMVFFTGMTYGLPYDILNGAPLQVPQSGQVLAVSGLANPSDFIEQCKQYGQVEAISFPDHYKYKPADIEKLNSKLIGNNKVICTEKDAVKLLDSELKHLLKPGKYYALPVQPKLLKFNENDFKHVLLETIKQTQKHKAFKLNVKKD